MRAWVLLSGSIICEVTGTLALRATVEHPAWVALTVAAYLAAFMLLGFALRAGMPIGVAYGVWGAVGVALVALLGAIMFDEMLSVQAVIGIAVIIVGVFLIEAGSRPEPSSDGGSEQVLT
ncbi:QacE family quaternary ammonium compound efflux SMR transporter [Leucobacter sp. UCMA 4100]|uniref:DMT family transporter n=1 Tax=Leucobacter sp. UCMA 4100 TaxID=2810534 RepID=UPI0022EAFA84|nr:SMR family transporter [Leucobacter sp. UCMA 4100]MDA3148169.1 QacE family quaternary ammonium compound efflux SMR transporter [Leucobacter sp. UCMA 4100]